MKFLYFLLKKLHLFVCKADFSVKIRSKNDVKCFKLKTLQEFLSKSIKIKNKLTPENYKKQIGPIYIITVEKEQQILLKSSYKISLSLYQFPYRIFKPDFSDLPYQNFNFSKPIVETCSHTNDLVYLTRGTYFLRLEKFLNNSLYDHLAGLFKKIFIKIKQFFLNRMLFILCLFVELRYKNRSLFINLFEKKTMS